MHVIHPGTVPASVYGPIGEACPGIAWAVSDLGSRRDYVHAGLDADATALRMGNLVDQLLADDGHLIERADLLVGWSFGGLVSLAVRERLQSCPGVLLLDTVAPTIDADGSRKHLRRWFADYLGHRAGRPLATPPPGAGAGRGLLAALHGPAIEAGAVAPDVSIGGFLALARAYTGGLERNVRMTASADWPRLDDVALVKPLSGLLPESAANGWDDSAKCVEVITCPGDHYSMLTDTASVAVITEEIRSRAQNARPVLTGGMTARPSDATDTYSSRLGEE